MIIVELTLTVICQVAGWILIGSREETINEAVW